MLRTYLILGRVSNLPTVWSNLLAGWLIAEGRNYRDLVALLLGGSFLYVGGMYLNDFCDVTFDVQFVRDRPIPAGKISRIAVGAMAGIWFLAGIACLAPFGWATIGIGLLLCAAIVLYDFRHKNVAWAPLVMGFCRCILYPLAASTVGPEIQPKEFIFATILGFYVAGITYLARGESRAHKAARWALLLLALPVVVPIWMCLLWHSSSLILAISASCLLLGWMAWLLVPLWRKTDRSVARVVAGLLAGIVLVDLIAVSTAVGTCEIVFPLLLGLALLLQRVIPAT